jgi:phage head maturation protease
LTEARLDLSTLTVDSVISVRDAAKRELDVRIMPWGVTIPTNDGTEEFVRGAFLGTEPGAVVLTEPEHQRRFALSHGGQPTLTRVPVGKGLSLDERDDGAYMTVRVAKTQAGDDILALAEDGIAGGVSIEFAEVPGGTDVQKRNGRRHRVHRRVRLEALSTTYRPAYTEAAVLAIRSEHEEPEVADTSPVEEPKVPVPTPVDYDKIAEIVSARSAGPDILAKLTERLEKVEEQSRSSFTVPSGPEEPEVPTKGEWMNLAVRLLSGERIADAQMRVVADFITTDNAGVVPDAYMTEIIGVIDAQRPFLTSTRRVDTPPSGMSIVFPKITQQPTTAVQASEKTELSSTKTIITTASFDAITIGGYGDLSLQLLKRSSPSFLGLYLELLAEAYAIDADEQAIQALANEVGGFGAGTALDPEALVLGPAFEASYDAVKRPPDTIWLSTEAVGAFIDAKDSGSNAPLYSNISANFTAGNAPAGLISGLRPVHVPALDAHGCFAIVGPSRGFAWAEDGTYTLQVDVPAKAGRDVGIVGMLWAMPLYPDAFSFYNVAS